MINKKAHLFYTLFVISVYLLGCQSSPMKFTHTAILRHINYEKNLKAGDTFYIKTVIDGLSKSNTVQLHIRNSYGVETFSPIISKNNYVFKIYSQANRRKGIAEFFITVENKLLHEGKFYVTEDTTRTNFIVSYVGPKFLIPNVIPAVSALSIPVDSMDNAISIKDTFDYYETDTKGILRTFPKQKKIGSASYYFEPKYIKGNYMMSAQYRESSSKLYAIHTSSDAALNYEFIISGYNGLADGYQLIHFKTDQIVDKYANIIPDGTLVNFTIIDREGHHYFTKTTTINGYAEADITQPERPTVWRVVSNIDNIATSSGVKLNFDYPIDSIHYELKDYKVNIAPVYTKLGYLIADGTQVNFIITHTNNKKTYTFSSQLKNGISYVVFNKDLYPKGDYSLQIEILGVRSKVTNFKI